MINRFKHSHRIDYSQGLTYIFLLLPWTFPSVTRKRIFFLSSHFCRHQDHSSPCSFLCGSYSLIATLTVGSWRFNLFWVTIIDTIGFINGLLASRTFAPKGGTWPIWGQKRSLSSFTKNLRKKCNNNLIMLWLLWKWN